jgi:thiamine-monophosphate kinase
MTHGRPVPGSPIALGPGAEFDRIRNIIDTLGAEGASLGDDCGVLKQDDGFLALSTDVSVEGVHFRLDWITPQEVGWRATASSLSDLAADAADPVGVLCAVTMPADAPQSELLDLMAGVRDAAVAAGAKVLGGDLSSGPVWSVAVTVVGRVGAPILRSGVEAGNRLWVTGTLGGARAALEAWLHQREPLAGARARFARPEPRINAGTWLARHGATAMIDLSDGIAGDAPHLAAASRQALTIDLDLIPVAEEAKHEALGLSIPAARFAAEGGEDYELLVSLPNGFAAADVFARECGIPLTHIGEATAGSGVRFLLSGRPVELRGFSHFG